MVGQYNNNNNFYWPLILIKLPFLLKKWKTLDFFESSIQHYKMAATSCYIFRYFGLRTGLNCPRTNVTRGGRVYFRPVMSSKSQRKPRGWSWLFTVVYSFLGSLLRVSQSLLNSFLYLGKLHWCPSLGQSYFYEPSVFTLRYVGDRISRKTWCWNEKDGGWEVISCLLLSCVLYCMEGEFEQIIRKQGQQQVTAE